MLRTALVGLGRIGWRVHLPKIISHDGFDLVTVVDTCPERLKEAKEQYGISGYTDFNEMLSEVNPDLVVIASPTHLHMQQTIAAMNNGTDVFLEKPMATSLDEAQKINAVRLKTGRKLMVYQPHRAVAEVTVLKEIISSGILGDIYMIKRAHSYYQRRNDWQALKKYGGGTLYNTGAHFFDQIFFIIGQNIKRVTCHCHRIAAFGDAEDVVKALIQTEGGITMDIDLNSASAVQIEPWMLFGRYGTVVKTEDEQKRPVFRAKYYLPEDLPDLTLSEDLAAQGRLYNNDKPIPWRIKDFFITKESEVDFYDKCYDYFALNKEPFVPIQETINIMEILQRCSEDSKREQLFI